jgi:hypothetical protein
MSADSRRAAKRIDVNRPVELAELDEYGAVVGYTQNLSEGGVRARFDVTPKADANVLVRLFLEDDREPVERRGRVVWSAPDIYGDGTEVGLRLLDDGEPDEDPGRLPVLPEQVLCVGQSVRVSRSGVAYDAVIAEIGEPDRDGRIPVVLSAAAEEQLGGEALDATEPTADDALDAEQWKPHPFRDAWRTVSRIAGPATRFVARLAIAFFAACGRGLSRVWYRLPAQPRASLESLYKRARHGLGRLRSVLARALAPVARRMKAERTARRDTDEGAR